MTSIKEKFNAIEGFDTFQRIDEEHILDIYIGKDSTAQKTLFMISEQEPPIILSSQIIRVFVGQRHDKTWGISFSLLDNSFEELFYHFCSDIVESSRDIQKKELGARYICERYSQWQDMLSKNKSGMLSFSVIKGLVGELVFLKEHLFPLYGKEKAIHAWIGPEGADQDYICDAKWYEIKSLVSGADTVHISSIEQLDSANNGELVLIYLDRSSYSDIGKITINQLYETIYKEIDSFELKKDFSKKLLSLGYYNRYEYEEYIFHNNGYVRYHVDETFPCLRRNDILASVVNAKYELSISSINCYKIGDCEL